MVYRTGEHDSSIAQRSGVLVKHLLTIGKLEIENANAVAGMTWGFPSIGHFLGFTHALGRKLPGSECTTGGCAIICHEHQHHSRADKYQPHRFCLTRNPLTSKGQTAPFNEEGRMHLAVTLVIEINADLHALYDKFAPDDTELHEQEWIENEVRNILLSMRLAGGVIRQFKEISLTSLDSNPDQRGLQIRKIMYRSLPGFVLVDRSHLLPAHHQYLLRDKPETSLLEAWMDFGGLRYRSDLPDNSAEDETTSDTEWNRVELPETGWLVPIMTGYQAIAPLMEAGSVPNCRDPLVPMCPVEAVYGVGQWISPHRIKDIEQVMWRYRHTDSEGYQFCNNYQPVEESTEVT